MLRFIAQRLLVTALVIAVTSIVAFSLVHLTGDPAVAMAGENASPEDVEAIRKLYGFDRPIWEQYLTWVARFVAGDFGRSHYLKLGVGEVLAEHIPVTAMLASFSRVGHGQEPEFHLPAHGARPKRRSRMMRSAPTKH